MTAGGYAVVTLSWVPDCSIMLTAKVCCEMCCPVLLDPRAAEEHAMSMSINWFSGGTAPLLLLLLSTGADLNS